MTRSLLLSATAITALVLAVPSQADWVKLGSVHVEHNRNRDMAYSDFAGPVENLSFTARGSDMWCRAITAHYRDGERQQVYSGRSIPASSTRTSRSMPTSTAASAELNA